MKITEMNWKMHAKITRAINNEQSIIKTFIVNTLLQ